MATLICLIRERSITTFINNWKHPYGLFLKKKWFMDLKIRKDILWKEGNYDITLERIKYKYIYTVKKIGNYFFRILSLFYFYYFFTLLLLFFFNSKSVLFLILLTTSSTKVKWVCFRICETSRDNSNIYITV